LKRFSETTIYLKAKKLIEVSDKVGLCGYTDATVGCARITRFEKNRWHLPM